MPVLLSKSRTFFVASYLAIALASCTAKINYSFTRTGSSPTTIPLTPTTNTVPSDQNTPLISPIDSTPTNEQTTTPTLATSSTSTSNQSLPSTSTPTVASTSTRTPTSTSTATSTPTSTNTESITQTPTITSTPASDVSCTGAALTNAPFAAGSGANGDPWQICTLAQLANVDNHLGDHFKLLADIALGSSFTPIGDCTTPFTGDFDGNHHTLSNWIFDAQTAQCNGIFAYVSGNTSSIHDLNVTNAQITNSGYRAGILAGNVASGATITRCTASGSITAIQNMTGGLVGQIDASTISYSSANVTMNSSAGWIGGLVGLMTHGAIVTDSHATGSVTASGDFIGGLLGSTHENCLIQRSYATGAVAGGYDVGGLVGYNYGAAPETPAMIQDSWASGTLSGNRYGGLSGECAYASFTNCYSISPSYGAIAHNSGGCTINSTYWDKTIGGNTSEGGTGLTTAEMKTQSMFSGWNFTTIWIINTGSYPSLR